MAVKVAKRYKVSSVFLVLSSKFVNDIVYVYKSTYGRTNQLILFIVHYGKEQFFSVYHNIHKMPIMIFENYYNIWHPRLLYNIVESY